MKPLLILAVLAAATSQSPPAWVTLAVRAPRVQFCVFDSAAARTKVSYHIYAPEVYDTEKTRRFPVLYWLHGSGGGLPGIPKLAAHFDAAIRAGKTPPMLVVFPNGLATSMWCDSKDGRVPMETVVVKELVPHIDAMFRTIAAREGRIIEGFSMGGYGAARLGFKYPELFGVVSMLGAGPLDTDFKGPRATARPAERERILQETFGGDLAYYKAQSPITIVEQNADLIRGKVLVRVAVGDRDEMLGMNRNFRDHLAKLKIAHTYAELPGIGHNPTAVLRALGEDQGQFYREALAAPILEVVAVLRDETALAGAHDIEVRDGVAFTAGKGGSVAVVDVKRPSAPKVLWSVRDPQEYDDAETVLPLKPGRLLVGTRDVFLFDVSRLTAPKVLAQIKDRPRVDRINGFARHGATVFAANKQGFIFAVSVAASDTIRLLGARETRQSGELASPHDVAFCGDLLVVVSAEGFGRNSQPGRLAIYRVLEPKTGKVLPTKDWSWIGKLEHPRLAGANRVMTHGAFAYVGSSLTQNFNRTDDLRGNVSVVDLSDPTQPKLCGSVDFPDMRGPNGLEVAGTVVFAAGGQTVQAVDVANPHAPRVLAHLTDVKAFPGAADDGHDLVYENGHLFVTAQTSHSLVILRVGQTLVKQIAACDCPDTLRLLAARARLPLPSHLVFVGDSLTALFPASNYVAKVRACLQAQFGDAVRVTNAGVGGDYITRVQARLENDVLQLEPKPTHVFLFLGHNDSTLKSSANYKEPVVKPEDFERQYREVVSAIQKTLGAKVIILSATSSVFDITKATAAKAAAAGKAHNLFGKPETLEQFNAIARKVAADLGADYVDLYEPTRAHPDKPSLFTADGVHISDAGNTLVAREVLRYLSR